MKQITIKELKEFCGCHSNNDFANFVSILLEDSEKISKIDGSEIGINYSKIQKKRSHRIYDKLNELGYYDDVKEV